MLARIIAVALLAVALSACATSFTGSAHIEGGAAECNQRCNAWGLEFAGMVAMGEYSDACICNVKGKSVSKADAAAVAGGSAGVVMQMRRQQQQTNATMGPVTKYP
jgi:hypothetical protein